jgi:iron complex transport system ATP-binding protein
MIALRDITVRMGDATLVTDVSATMRPGRLTAVVGPNGAGKTTLLRVATGELAPTAGTVEMDGRPLEALPEREQARRRAVLPQQSQLHFAFSALEVVLMGRTPHLRGAESARDWEIAHAALRTVGMDDFADRDVPTLSGGEQQRVHLARALAQIWTPPEAGHRYLLLDEPTASLDLAHQHQVLRTAAGLAADGVGVLAILHDLNLAAQYADHVVMLRRGAVHGQGPPGDVLTPAAIADVFGCPVRVLTHPTQSCPLIVADAAARAPTPAAAPA